MLPDLSSQLSVFSKLCIMNTLLHFLLLFQLCRSLRNISLGGPTLGKSKVIITIGWVWRRHQRSPLFSLASDPQTSNPPLPTLIDLKRCCVTKKFVAWLRKAKGWSPQLKANKLDFYYTLHEGCGVGVARSRRFSDGVGFLRTLGVQFNHFLHCTPKLRVLTRACWNVFLKLL